MSMARVSLLAQLDATDQRPTAEPGTIPEPAATQRAAAENAGAVEKVSEVAQDFIISIPNLLIGVGLFLTIWALGVGVKWLVTWVFRNRKQHRNFAIVMGRLAVGIAFIVGILVACVVIFPNFTPTDAISFLGLGSVAIGFAFRDVLQNYLAGILLLITEPFRIGDQVVFGDFEGTVEEIQTRATFVRTYDGRRVVIPNTELFTNSVVVNTAFDKRRIEYDVGIGYGDDIEKAKRLMLEAVRESGVAVEDPPPDVLVWELAGSSVNIRVRWWIAPPGRKDVLDAKDQVLERIKNKLTASGIDLPFPTQQILFHDQTEETDGDRKRQREGWPAGKGEAPKPRGIAKALRNVGEVVERQGKGGSDEDDARGGGARERLRDGRSGGSATERPE